MAKRAAEATPEDVAAALAAQDGVSQPSNEQLDLLLPSEGFEILSPPPPSAAAAPPAAPPEPTSLLGMSANEIDAFFITKFGASEDAQFDAMCKTELDELERLQGLADDARAAGVDDEAQGRGLYWSTAISRVVA